MKKQNTNPWFPAKKNGFGWGLPITWQGWVIFAVYLVLCITGSLYLTDPPSRLPAFFIYILFISGLLYYICLKKGERPKR